MSESASITTICPHCSAAFEVPASLLGNKGRCDQCQAKFIIAEFAKPQATARPKRSSKLPVVFALCLIGVSFGYLLLSKEPNKTQAKVVATEAVATEPSPEEIIAEEKTLEVLEVPAREASEPTRPSPDAPQLEIAKDDAAIPNAPTEEPAKRVNPVPEKEMAVQKSPGVLTLEALPEPGSSDLSKAEFPVKTQFSLIDIGEYQKTYPDVFNGWLPNNKEEAEDAKAWGNHYGPLGIRTRSHVPQLQGRPAFAANIPNAIRTTSGELGLNAAEVIDIAPGSPAENHLAVGDLIVGIDGQALLSGNQYRPDWQFMHKDARELQLMFGEEIDKAQGSGAIRFTVLRYPAKTREGFARDLKSSDGRISSGAIPVSAGDEIHLIVDPKESNDADHFAWLSPMLSGQGVSLDLADAEKIQPTHATTGWGKISYGKDLQGRDLREPGITIHAESKLIFVVPPGYDTFQTFMRATDAKADLTAKILIAQVPQPLPVETKDLWVGKGGDQSVGLQPFDLEISGDGFITLVSDQFDEVIHGDSTAWLDVTLEGSYGTVQLLEMTPEFARAGYGNPRFATDKPFSYKGKDYDQSLNLHAHGAAKWKLPHGTKRIKGSFAALSYGKVQPKIQFTNIALPLTGVHLAKLVPVSFPIGKTGSFSNTYPKDCPKSELTSRRQTAWLAAQQREDGTWPRLRGYTGEGWDTAWCGLALMSSGDASYDAQVRKAAYRVAYDNAPSEWTAERAMRLIFLSEYYLRSKDAQIIPGIQAAYDQLMDCCKTDFMAGHKVNGFGYGISGQHYGTGHLALATALASQTPITTDQSLVEGIIRHAGEVCVNGTYAYGRGRRMARDDSRKHGGGNAMSGPGMLGVMIGGGHSSSIQEYIERMDASLGDGDNSHASSSLAFIFSSLAIACGDEDLFLKHMQNFRYKMTIDDNWEGGFLKSAFPLDFQGGEGVTSTWIRSAGSILVLNALKHNLAITGKKELWNPQRIHTPAVSEWGGQIHSYYLRNWCLASELLGNRSPRKLAEGIKTLHTLPRTLDLVPSTRTIVAKLAPGLVAGIAKDSSLTETQRAYAIELITGLDFKIYTKKNGEQQQIDLEINLPLHQLNWRDTDKATMFAKTPFPLQSKINITGDNIDGKIPFETENTEQFNLDQGSRKMSASVPLKDPTQETFDGTATIAFKLGNNTITYKRPMRFNTVFSHSNHYNLRRLQLKLRVAPRACFQSQPLIIAGIPFDSMYPLERMLDVKPSEAGATINIHEGDEVLVDIASENLICPWVHTMEFQQVSQVQTFKPRTHKTITGHIQGSFAKLLDFKTDTYCDITGAPSKAVIEYDFGKDITSNGLDANYDGTCFIRVWYKDRDHWIPLVWDNYSVSTSHHPTFPDTKAQLWRIELHPGASKKFQSLRFYHNPNLIAPQAALPQTRNIEYLPPIEPQ